jgi:predicted nucleic acid-binding Zn ribbon protein
MKRDLARELFRSYRSSTRKKNPVIEEERIKRDEPERFNVILNELVLRREWQTGLAEGNLFTQWPQIIGDEIAEHCEPITILDGKLTIRAQTTAWATQLRLLSGEILKRIQQSAPGATIEELHVIGPNAPTWKRGLRTIRGSRGPRDTYG